MLKGKGELKHIYIASRPGSPMQAVDAADAIYGSGIQGDRYAAKRRKPPGGQVTLIDMAHILAYRRETCLPLAPHEPRRNLVTAGVDLNALCGARFRIGDVELEGVELCEPCSKLARRTHPEALRFFVHKGGLNARIIKGGRLSIGMQIDALPIHGDTTREDGR